MESKTHPKPERTFRVKIIGCSSLSSWYHDSANVVARDRFAGRAFEVRESEAGYVVASGRFSGYIILKEDAEFCK